MDISGFLTKINIMIFRKEPKVYLPLGVSHFVVHAEESTRISEALRTRSLTAEDIVCIETKDKMHTVWYKCDSTLIDPRDKRYTIKT